MSAALRHTADRNAALIAVLRSGFAWLFSDNKHPKGALLQHHGIFSSGQTGGMNLVPSGAASRPVVVFTLNGPSLDPVEFTRTDCSELMRYVLAALPSCASVRDSWNGVGTDSFSVGLEPRASAPILGLVNTYLAGCPDHQGSVFCRCGWFSEGRARVVMPEGWR